MNTPVLDEAVEGLIAAPAAVSIWLLVRLWLVPLLLMQSLAIRVPVVLLMPLCRLLHRAWCHDASDFSSEAGRALA